MNETDRARRAVEYLIESAAEIAAAEADMVRAEKMLGHIEALAMRASGETSAAAQQREARASKQYRQGVDDIAEATRVYRELRAKREAAQARVEFWRSLNANQRAAERGYGSAA